jgi:hypothetical protein
LFKNFAWPAVHAQRAEELMGPNEWFADQYPAKAEEVQAAMKEIGFFK